VYALRNLLKTNLKDDLGNVKGIGWKDNGVSILNPPEKIVPQERMDIDLPGYAWDLLPYNKKPFDLYRSHFWHANFDYSKRTPFAAIYTSLGCPFGCNFCMINILNRNNNDDNISSEDSRVIRYWSTDLITKEFEKLVNYGVETVRLSDEMFFLKKSHFEPLLTNLIDRKYPLHMWAYSRIDTVQEKYIELFKNSGIKWLALGIEAANQNIRLEITKGSFKNINIRDTVKLIESHELNVMANYIFGFPSDTYKTMNETLDLAIDLNTVMANFYPWQALPGSTLYIQAKKSGWELPKNPNEFAFLSYECKPLPTNYLMATEVLKFRDEAWVKYFTNPKYLERVKNVFGPTSHDNIINLTKIKLKRKLLGD
jgi:anaerobic magnesium-protoporphyrin IX monomethyl ester cyclase